MILLESTALLQDILKTYENKEMANIIGAMTNTLSQISSVSQKVIPIALLLHLLVQYTKIVNEKRLDWVDTGKYFLMILFFLNYQEVMGVLNSILGYFTNGIGERFTNFQGGNSLVDKMDEVWKEYKKTHPTTILSGLENVFDWIVANCTHLIIIVSRTVTYAIRDILLVFLLMVGPIAIVIGLFPGFEGNLRNWLKYYVSVAFWAVTLCILDIFLYYYLDACIANNNTEGTISINITIALMYLIAPYLTSRYIMGQGSQFMSRMVQMATSSQSIAMKSVSGGTTAVGAIGGAGLKQTGNLIQSMGGRMNNAGLSNLGSKINNAGKVFSNERNPYQSMGSGMGRAYSNFKTTISKNVKE